jgi:hypothetical protein
MLEEAEKGEQIQYSWYLLPVARMGKVWSVILNLSGRIGPVPEGMSATAALRNVWFSKEHERLKSRVLVLAEEFKNRNHYTTLYWNLIKLARQAKGEMGEK